MRIGAISEQNQFSAYSILNQSSIIVI